ncbi:unnamed protein product [Caenorhabditis bovis]|uniref:DNA-directed RNA polymerase n=1 Tax=Caenorhabditis bovis TaxID=2654633 RepID=A0A8S1F4F5_9PELO|nr:unnamed protein product [Caenorhabditis bovis]
MKLLQILEKDYKKKTSWNRLEVMKKSTLARIMRCSVNDDIQGLMRIAENQTRIRAYDEILPICLLVLSKRFEEFLRTVDAINSDKALSIFLGICNLLRGIRRDDNSSNIMCLLVLNTLRQWKDERKFDSKSHQIADIFDSMNTKLTFSARNCRLEDLNIYISDADRLKIEKELRKIAPFEVARPRRSAGPRYDMELRLVAPLQSNCPSDEYRGNPFQLDHIDTADYMRKFSDHLKTEESMWMRVKNTMTRGDDVERFAEDLIREWNWEGRIRENLGKMDPEETHPIVGACLEVLDRDRFVELLTFCAMSVCSQGQNLIGASQFEYELVTPIVRELCNIFKIKVGYDEKTIWNKVFGTYIQYFEDSEKSRKHTHREWWEKACKSANIKPDYQFEIGNLDAMTRKEVSSVLFNVILKSCVFPVSSRNSKKCSWCPAFSFRAIAFEEESRVASDGKRQNLSRMLAIHSHLMSLFEANPFEFIIFSTDTLPLTIPPRPWLDYGIGGPLYTHRLDIVRNMYEFKAVNLNDEARNRIREPQQARPVFDALNQLGSTPWVINEKMLDVLKEVFAESGNKASEALLDKLGIPMRSDTIAIPDFQQEFGRNARREQLNVEKWRDYARRKAEAIKIRNESNSLWCWMLYRVVLADHFRGRTLYFPHNMDFRGRVYPLSPYLSHMGDDVNRCILKFAKKQPLGENGLEWLKLHCINLTGTMKRASIADRMRKVEELMPTIRDSARNPLNGEKWWMESEEPWQTLAACIEIDDALKFGSDSSQFLSQLPVHQDGSCNGLQHYAALGRDREGGTQVNLTKCDLPNDVYSDVAKRVEQKRLEDERGRGEDMVVARKLREALPQNVPRKVIKQTVMTTVYGVTMYGAVQQIKRQLKAMNMDYDDCALFARYLARKTFSSLDDAFKSSMALKDWFRLCAKGTSELMKTVEWITPLGLPVVQPYCRIVERKGKLVLAPIPMKQISAFPPNFVHSLDSTHMMLTSLNCARRGLTFAAVHDCFWTHANSVDEMNAICRQQFIDLHSQPIVEQCSEWLKKTYLTESMRKVLPEHELEKYEDMFTVKVEPGELDIEEVKKSIYFFS